MTKILKSRYSVYKNFEEDVFGRFLFKMKRRDITCRLLSYSKILNRVEPLRLADLLIRRKKKIRGLESFDKIRFFKFRHFYGLSFGKTKIFNKTQYALLHRSVRNRRFNSILSIEARLDVVLVKLFLFNSIFESRTFIKNEGVFVNDILVNKFDFLLTPGDILSFSFKNKILLKRKLYRLLRAKTSNVPFTNSVTRELNSTLTSYIWLFKRCTGASPFFLVGFPRYFEFNFNSMEFFFYGTNKVDDLFYPFKTSLSERSSFFSNFI
jgi:ribosomal protein S4